MQQKCCACTNCTMAKFAQWANFSEQDLKQYKCGCDFLTYNHGENIFQQDTRANGIYCLQSGHVMLWHMDEIGNEIGFRVVGAGDLFGHRAYFGDDVHAATAVALTNCVICFHHKDTISMILDKYPAVSRYFLRLMALDRGPPDSLLLRNTYLPVKVRLINLLLILKRLFAKDNPDGSMVFELPLFRRDISTMIAARPETVARAIRELEKDGLAYFNGRIVTVPAIDSLKEIAMENMIN